jgi:hypothetical protein
MLYHIAEERRSDGDAQMTSKSPCLVEPIEFLVGFHGLGESANCHGGVTSECLFMTDLEHQSAPHVRLEISR